MTNITFFLFLFFSLISVGYSQTNVVWSNTYQRLPESMIKDSDSNIVTIGGTWGPAFCGVTKYNQKGDILWSLPLSWGAGDFTTWHNRKIAVDSNNNIYFTVTWSDASNNNYDRVVKITASGVLAWETSYMNTDIPGRSLELNGLVLDSQKSVYVYGMDVNTNSYGRLLVLKYNANGVYQWKKVISGNLTGNCIAYCLAVDSQDNIVIGGSLDINGFTRTRKNVLYKFDQSGNAVWQVEEDNVGFSPSKMIIDAQDNVILAGPIHGSTPSSGRIVKYNLAGIKLSDVNNYELTASSWVGLLWPTLQLLPDQNGNFYVTSGYQTANNIIGYRTAKFDSNCQVLWQNIHTPNSIASAVNMPTDAAVDGYGNISVTGVSFNIDYQMGVGRITNLKDATVKYNSNGNKLWEATRDETPSVLGWGGVYSNPCPALVMLGNYTYVGTKQSNATAPGVITKYSDNDVASLYSGCVNDVKGAEVLVPLYVDNFKNVISAQFSISWDQSIASFVGVEEFGLKGLDANSFGLNQANSGKLTFSWNDPTLQSQTLADGSTLFSVRLKLIGNYGESTSVVAGDSPLGIEIIELNSGSYKPLEVSLNSCTVSIDPLSLYGKIDYPSLQGVQSVDVALSGSDTQAALTDASGAYYFSISTPVDNSSTYTISPSKVDDPNPLNGIDVQDIVAIRRHILGVQSLSGPYAIIAADVNQSNSVSTLDLVYIQALILGNSNTFPNNTQWTFVPKNYAFVDGSNPFPYPQSLTLSPSAALTSNDFTGIKLGDANMTRDNSQMDRMSSLPVTIDIHQEKVHQGDAIEIPIRAKDFVNISGYQFTFSWDVDKMEYLNATNKAVTSNFGVQKTQSGKLTIMWDDSRGQSLTLKDTEELFVLQFFGKGGGYKDLNVTGELTPMLAVDKDLVVRGVQVMWSEKDKDAYSKMLTVFPNPFAELISMEFYSESNGVADVAITDELGRSIHQWSTMIEQGTNKITWDGKNAFGTSQTSGVYILSLITPSGVTKAKVVKSF